MRHLCVACRERRAKFRYHGEVRADRDHVLCFQCFRSERERTRARQLATRSDASQGSLCFEEVAPQSVLPRAAHALTEAQLAHRRAMLSNLRRQRTSTFGSQ